MMNFARIAVAVAATVIATPLAAAETQGSATFHVPIRWSGSDASCPSGYSRTTECHPHRGGSVAVPGLGVVSESYLFAVDVEPGPPCAPGSQRALSYPAQLTVAGRGVISIDVATASDCAEEGIPLLSSPQTFTITGGTGAFAGASGNGVVTRTGTGCCPGFAMDNWDGKVGAPGLIVDLTPPTITGAVDKLVRAPRYRLVRVSRTRTKRVPVTSVRVTYHVSAADDLDGTVPVTCSPSSGSRFHVGRTRTVTCSATDKSANALTAQFNVTIKRK